jgi:hypothetical protein
MSIHDQLAIVLTLLRPNQAEVIVSSEVKALTLWPLDGPLRGSRVAAIFTWSMPQNS